MKGPDLDRERSEKERSLKEFLALYNEGLPPGYPRASAQLLKQFSAAYPALFKGEVWSLGQHRKRLMDWLPAHVRESQEAS
jgi:hypothetical protein